MNRNIRQAVTIFTCVLVMLTGCASVTIHKDRLDRVKSVAIVGFSGEVALRDPKEKDSGIAGTINAIKATTEVANGEYTRRRAEQAEQIYGLLAKKLEEGLGWTVLPKDRLPACSEYAALVEQHPQGGLGKGYGEQLVPGVLREEAARNLDEATRARLAKALGVDAIAVAHVKYVVGDKSGFSVGGMGKVTKYPKAIVTFTVYDATSPDPAWKDAWAEGKPSKEGLENVMGVNVDEKETPVLIAAADSGFGTLLDRYKAQVGKN